MPSSVLKTETGPQTIACTYKECQHRFENDKLMRKHKKREAEGGSHPFYCSKCDFDATDDTEKFIHQLESPKHSRYAVRNVGRC